MIDVTCYAPTRDIAASFLKAAGIAQLDPTGKTNDFAPMADVLMHPYRESETITINKDPSTLVAGFHFNLRFYVESEIALTKGLVQTDSKGNLLGLFERTRILALVQSRTNKKVSWVSTNPPVPAGYESPEGVRAFDPDTITDRKNTWA